MNVYCLSGIAADRRVFKHLKVPAGYTVKYIDWTRPELGESLPDYANRLTGQIDLSEPFVLVGISLGGIMATEIAKRHAPVCTIVIGSVPQASQLPPYYKVFRKLKLQALVPTTLLLWAASMKRYFTHESVVDKKVIRQMIWESSHEFLRWGMQAVLDWKNEVVPQPYWHVHGTRDEVFPIRWVRPTHTIQKGDHLLTVSHPDAINVIVAEILTSIEQGDKKKPAGSGRVMH